MNVTDASLICCRELACEEHLTDLGIVGGATYDALILRAAANAKVDLVATFNEKDFKRVYPDLEDKIVSS